MIKRRTWGRKEGGDEEREGSKRDGHLSSLPSWRQHRPSSTWQAIRDPPTSDNKYQKVKKIVVGTAVDKKEDDEGTLEVRLSLDFLISSEASRRSPLFESSSST